MTRPIWVEDLSPEEGERVEDRRLLHAILPDGRERALELVARGCWELAELLDRAGNWADQKRSARQWERARRGVGS